MSASLEDLRAAAKIASGQAKGQALEVYVRALFELADGVTLKRQDALNDPGSEEYDLVFWIENERLSFAGPILIVECKHWAAPVGAKEVRDFQGKLSSTGVSLGVLVAANGVSGGEELRAARDALRAARTGPTQVSIAVLTLGDLDAVGSGDDLVEILIEATIDLIARRRPSERAAVKGRVFPKLEDDLVRGIMREARLSCLEEAQQRKGDTRSMEDAVAAVRMALRDVDTAREIPSDQDPLGDNLRASLIDLIAATMTVLDQDDEWDGWSREWLASSMATSGMERVRAWPGSRLWAQLTNYYADELSRPVASMEIPTSATAVAAIAALAFDVVLAIDDYVPDEPYPAPV